MMIEAMKRWMAKLNDALFKSDALQGARFADPEFQVVLALWLHVPIATPEVAVGEVACPTACHRSGTQFLLDPFGWSSSSC